MGSCSVFFRRNVLMKASFLRQSLETTEVILPKAHEKREWNGRVEQGQRLRTKGPTFSNEKQNGAHNPQFLNNDRLFGELNGKHKGAHDKFRY
jgi:hypothetical protein